MQRLYPGSSVTFESTVLVEGVLTDAPAMTFDYTITRNGEQTKITPTRVSAGVYSATFTLPPLQSGNLHYQWNTNSPLGVVDQGKVNIAPSVFA